MSITIAQSVLEATQLLREAGVPEARREAASLLAYAIGKDRTFIISHAEDLVSREQFESFHAYVERRAQGEPFQYITGHQEFFGLSFEVSKDVLIPRPETELLVETALKVAGGPAARLSICDIGTGSGCVAITLLHELPLSRAIAIDVSEAAIRVARKNADRHSVADRLSFMVSDCFSALANFPMFDLIVSNPPYVAAGALCGLQREVRDYEPRVALSPGFDGLQIIRLLLSQSGAYLNERGYLLIEIGFDQHAAIAEIIDRDVWEFLDIPEDLQGIPRVVALQKIGFRKAYQALDVQQG